VLPKFSYSRPESLSEALELLEERGDEARLLAGGTDLLVSMRDRVVKPGLLIDVKGIKELGLLSYSEETGLKIGATVTLNDLLASEVVKKRYSVLHEAVQTIADDQLRNRATLVGNICNASPAADSAPALLVLDAVVKVVGKGRERTIELKDFFRGVKKTALERGELVSAVQIPSPPTGARGRYLKAMRVWSEDLAIVGVAALVGAKSSERDERDVRLAYASVAPTPIRPHEAEAVFRGRAPTKQLIDKAVSIAVRKMSPISDVRGGVDYRLNLIEVLTRRALSELLEEN